jgi:hypothetical protein
VADGMKSGIPKAPRFAYWSLLIPYSVQSRALSRPFSSTGYLVTESKKLSLLMFLEIER